MAFSATRTPNGRRLSPLAQATFEDGTVLGFKSSLSGFEELAARDDHDVEAWRDLVSSENLSYQSFSAISLHGAAQFLGRRNPEATQRAVVWQDKERAEAAMKAGTALVHLLELGASTDPFVGTEPTSHGHAALLAADGEPLSALGTTPFEHQPPVFRAHPDQKAVRPLATPLVRLKCALSFCHRPRVLRKPLRPRRREAETLMVANRFGRCQSTPV